MSYLDQLDFGFLYNDPTAPKDRSRATPLGMATAVDPLFKKLSAVEMQFMADGLCKGMNPDLFFPGDGEHIHPEAKAACGACPVNEKCRRWAIKHKEFGYWGGTTERERLRLRRGKRAW